MKSQTGKRRLRGDDIVLLLIALGVVYVGLACAVFAFRHPWMTQTERILHLPTAVRFGTVPYQEARPR